MVPCHGADWRVLIRIFPPWFLTTPCDTHSPRPVPLSRFVVKKGSKARWTVSGDIPPPLSEIEIQTVSCIPVAGANANMSFDSRQRRSHFQQGLRTTG